MIRTASAIVCLVRENCCLFCGLRDHLNWKTAVMLYKYCSNWMSITLSFQTDLNVIALHMVSGRKLATRLLGRRHTLVSKFSKWTIHSFMTQWMRGSKLFSKLDFAQNWNSTELLSQDRPWTFFFQVRFGTLLVGPVTLFFLHHFILSVNVKALVSFTFYMQ